MRRRLFFLPMDGLPEPDKAWGVLLSVGLWQSGQWRDSPVEAAFLCGLMNGTRSSRVALYAGTIPTRILSVRPDPGARDMEVVFRLDVVQMDEPFLASRLVNADSRKSHL